MQERDDLEIISVEPAEVIEDAAEDVAEDLAEDVAENVPAVADVTEDVEQIGKDIVVGRKEVRYEDGKNIISVIINAISVRINMPRGTSKTSGRRWRS